MALETPSASSSAVHNVMIANRSVNTGPERVVRRMLREAGLAGYRLHWRIDDESGRYICRPDITYPGRRIAIFVHGCFWHQHNCRDGRIPDSNQEYWEPKLLRTIQRDREHRLALTKSGWKSLVVWECQLKSEAAVMRRVKKFLDA